jgi:hypothetical protein
MFAAMVFVSFVMFAFVTTLVVLTTFASFFVSLVFPFPAINDHRVVAPFAIAARPCCTPH